MSLVTSLLSHLEARGLLSRGERVLVACSGGADSTALACLMVDAAEPLGLAGIALAHLDHGLRADSDADARFVTALASQLATPLVARRNRVEARPGESPEEAARRVRYAFLTEAAAEAGADVVVTAHHLDDQAETLLYRVSRGTGLGGLAGIREDVILHGVRFVRPLLAFRSDELRAELDRRGQSWCEDPTNVDGNVRARIRHQALPALNAAVGRDAAPALARLARIAAEAGEDATSLASRFVTPDADGVVLARGVERLPAAERAAALSAAIQFTRASGQPSCEAEIRRLLAQLEGDMSQSLAGIDVRAQPSGWLLRPASALSPPPATTHPASQSASQPTAPPCVALPVPGAAEVPAALGGGTLVASLVAADNAAFLRRLRRSDGALELLDAAALRGTLRVRARREGDRFQPLGASQPARLGHYLQRRGVPDAQRGHVPLVTDDEGILWVVGHGIADRARVCDDSTTLLMLDRT